MNQFAAKADHLDCRNSRLESLVSRLDAGAVERLLKRFACQYAKAVRNTGLLLRLANAARHLVVNGFVMGSLAAQQAAKRDNSVDFAKVGKCACGRGNLPRSGNCLLYTSPSPRDCS